jgi:hypothetical protein
VHKYLDRYWFGKYTKEIIFLLSDICNEKSNKNINIGRQTQITEPIKAQDVREQGAEMFGPKREEVAGGCRILHIEELNKLRASSNVIRLTL